MSEFWRALGARVDVMEPDHHDLVLAVTSHAPPTAISQPERASVRRSRVITSSAAPARRAKPRAATGAIFMRIFLCLCESGGSEAITPW